MNRRLNLISALIVLFTCSMAFSGTLSAFEWSEKGISVKESGKTEKGTRISLVDGNQKTFVVIYEKDLLTDPVKEAIYAVFSQISDTYNLPATTIEFMIKPGLFQTNLLLSQTKQTINITNHGLKPSESLIPTLSTMINEFSEWKDLKIASLQIVAKAGSFQTIATTVMQSPIVNLRFASAQPQKKIISDLAVFYNDLSSWEGLSLKEFNLVVGQSTIEATINGEDGKGIDLTYHGTKLNPQQLKNISQSYNTIAGWKNIDFKRILFSAKPEEINVVVTLSKAVYKRNNLISNLPSGISMTYDEGLSYNFRTVSGQYFVQIRGDYTGEDKLLWQVNEAIKDPILYIQKYDPEFFFRQLEGIRNQNAEIFNELKTNHEQLLVKYNNLKQAHDRFIYGFINMQNSGFMSSGDINKQAIKRIVELKSANTELNRNQIESQLKKEKFDVSDKVVDMVLNLYFNDFN